MDGRRTGRREAPGNRIRLTDRLVRSPPPASGRFGPGSRSMSSARPLCGCRIPAGRRTRKSAQSLAERGAGDVVLRSGCAGRRRPREQHFPLKRSRSTGKSGPCGTFRSGSLRSAVRERCSSSGSARSTAGNAGSSQGSATAVDQRCAGAPRRCAGRQSNGRGSRRSEQLLPPAFRGCAREVRVRRDDEPVLTGFLEYAAKMAACGENSLFRWSDSPAWSPLRSRRVVRRTS